jgi:uncharacterized protein YoxC
MVLRETVAERVSDLKKRLPTTPILKEMSMTAKIISSDLLAFPQVGGIIPAIARGKAYGELAGVWYHVTFTRELMDPSLAAIGEGRRGVIPTPKAPTIDVPSVSIGVPSVSIGVPSVSVGVVSARVPRAAAITIPAVRSGHVPTSLGRFACGWAIASLTDGLNDLVVTMESVLVRVNELIDDLVGSVNDVRSSVVSVDEKVDDLRNKVNDALESLRSNAENASNNGLDALRKNTEQASNAGLDKLRENTEKASTTGLGTLRKNVESAVNKGLAAVIPELYAAWGIPQNMAPTPVHVRNVTSTGFDFQSYGKTTVYYIAMGSLR